MKKWLILLLLSIFVSKVAHANLCPPVAQANPNNPPAGWDLLLPPFDTTTDAYYFGSAVHSLNGSFHYKKIVCAYETCPSWGCYRYELISQADYDNPNSPAAPWNQRATIRHTFLCIAYDHNPESCPFS